jgi:hypothetical protein
VTQAFDEDLIGGRYRLVRQVGQGGMGTVWQARDELLDRTVAIKQLASPFGTAAERAEQVERIRREARMAARLDHTGVVRVYDIIDWTGSPAIVMEYVKGRSLAVRLRESGALTVQETVALGIALLDALRHAHGAGVVHRDLKPDNVLLDDARVVITDFGIARPLDGATALTRPGAIIGTPAFMAPEQIEGREVTAASDLWSLGVTLFTAVEGDQPFKGETMAQLCVAVLTQPMPAPRYAGELTPLLEALLVKNPEARANAQWAAQFLAAAAVPGALAAETSTVFEVPSVGAGAPTLTEPAPAQVPGGPPAFANEPTATAPPTAADPDEPKPQPSPRLRRRAVVITLACTVVAAAVIVPLVLAAPDTPRAHTGALAVTHTGSASPKGSASPTGSASSALAAFTDPGGSMTTMAVAPNGTILAMGTGNGSIYLWNMTTRKISATLTDPNSYGVSAVAFAPNSTTLAVGDNNGNTYLWNAGTGKNIRTLIESQSTETVTALAFAPDGTTLAGGAGGQGVGTVYVWNTTTGTNTNTFNDPSFDSVIARAIAFAPGGTTLAIGDGRGTVYLWNTATGNTTATFTTPDGSGTSALAFSPSGSTLAVGTGSGKAFLWNTGTRKYTATFTTPDGASASAMAFAPSGSTLAVGTSSGRTYLLNTATAKNTATFTGRNATTGVDGVAFAPSGGTLIIGNVNGSIYEWHISE